MGGDGGFVGGFACCAIVQVPIISDKYVAPTKNALKEKVKYQ